jgi:hypothetical protein
MMANHKPAQWEWMGEKFEVKEGQFITSIDSIKNHAGKKITTQNIRSALAKFEKYGFLTNKSTKTGRLISIVNWHIYQCCNDEANKDNNKEVTKNQQRGNKELTPNKNDKNVKNEKKEKNEDTITDYKSLYDYYLTLNLIKHKNYTDAMRSAIKKAIKENKYTLEDCKVLLERHSKVVKLTKKSDYKVKARGLDVFFGQKVSGGTNLICSEYEEGGNKYETHLRNKKESKYIPVEGNVYYVDKEPTEDEEVMQGQQDLEIPF